MGGHPAVARPSPPAPLTAMKKAAMKKVAMKTVMKTVMKTKRVSVIAKGRLAKAIVLRGDKQKTASGLKKSDLHRNKRGKVVSKKASAAGKKAFGQIRGWQDCVKKAKKALGLSGFVPVNGKTQEGKALYAKAKALYSA